MEVACFFLFAQIIALFAGIHGQCPWEDDALPSVANGFRSNTENLKLYQKGLAYGYYDIDCDAGYRVDSTTNGHVICQTSGSWSQPLPQCESTGRCAIPALFQFLQSAEGLRYDRSSSAIYTDGVHDDQALGGSKITVYCARGYQNTGGPLEIICTEANSWTTFPNCVSNSSSTTTSTAQPVPTCPVDDDTWTFPNGYVSKTSDLTIYSDKTAVGSAVVSCSGGYAIDAVSNGQYTCNNGVWSVRPYCTKTPRCSLSTLNAFMNDPVASIGLQISSQRLQTISKGSDDILIGSNVLFSCQNGYASRDDATLNVICNADGQWSAYPTCSSTAADTSSGRCLLTNGELPTVANGHRSNVDHLVLYSSGVAEGYYDVACDTGYQLDSTIGGRITCLPSGAWSQPLPQCKSTGRCSIPALFDFIIKAEGLQYDRSSSAIYTDGVHDDQALGGSNITVRCAREYQNTGGPLVILCTEASSWTTFPNCVSNSSSTTTTTTTAVPACPVNDDTWTFPNGHLSKTSDLTLYNDKTAVGSVVVECSVGYAIDAVSNGQYTCNNGVWSARPYCTETPRCSYATLKNFLADSAAIKGLKIASQKISTVAKNSDDILIGSYVQFNCKNAFTATSKANLKVTCNANGQWSTFPSCTPKSTTTLASTTKAKKK